MSCKIKIHLKGLIYFVVYYGFCEYLTASKLKRVQRQFAAASERQGEIAELVDVNEVSDDNGRQLQEEQKAMADPHLEADEVLEMVLKPEEAEEDEVNAKSTFFRTPSAPHV